MSMIVQNIQEFFWDIELLSNPHNKLSEEQKKDLTCTLVTRIVGVACAVLTTACFIAISSSYVMAVTLLVGSISLIAAHDLLVFGDNWRDLIMKTQAVVSGTFGEWVDHVISNGKVLYDEVRSKEPFQLKGTWVLLPYWQWQNPDVL